jgi:hypothetical protein
MSATLAADVDAAVEVDDDEQPAGRGPDKRPDTGSADGEAESVAGDGSNHGCEPGAVDLIGRIPECPQG